MPSKSNAKSLQRAHTGLPRLPGSASLDSSPFCLSFLRLAPATLVSLLVLPQGLCTCYSFAWSNFPSGTHMAIPLPQTKWHSAIPVAAHSVPSATSLLSLWHLGLKFSYDLFTLFIVHLSMLEYKLPEGGVFCFICSTGPDMEKALERCL